MQAIQTFWSEADSGKKVGVTVGLVTILLFLVAAVIWLMRVDYQVLFSGVNTRDAASVVSELERMKIDYRLEQGGTRILVPSDIVHQARLKLMGSDMPIAGTIGLEIFNDSDFGMTEFAQKINYQRALQGELTRTIMSLDEVKYARVHLVMPESGIFKSQGKKPSASVTLFLKNGQIPNDGMIGGIQRLVSSSVPELESGMVTVSDQRGQTLSKPPMDEMGMETISRRLQKQQEVEKYYTDKIRKLLANRYRPDEMAVSVNISLSYEQTRVTRKGVLGEKGSTGSGVLRRRESSFGAETRKEKNKGTNTTEVEYELGHQIEQSVQAPGQILRISVGVIVPPQLEEQQRAEIKSLVSMVIGFDESRGDAIAVYSNYQKVKKDPIEAQISEINAAGKKTARAISDVNEEMSTKKIEKAQTIGVSAYQVLKDLVSDPQKVVALIFIVSIAVILFLWWILAILKSNRNKRASVLNQDEREEVLAQIQEWLASEDDKKATNEVSA